MITIPGTTIFIILILLPGFVSLIVDRMLVYRPQENNLDKLIRAVVYTFFIHVVYTLIFNNLTPWQINLNDSIFSITVNSRKGLVILYSVSIFVGIITGVVKNKDWVMKMLRKLELTNRTARSSIWQDIFVDKRDNYITVHLENDLRIVGWPEYYSDDYFDGPVIFLTNASWSIGEEWEDIPNPGILVNSSEIKFIQFYSPEEK